MRVAFASNLAFANYPLIRQYLERLHRAYGKAFVIVTSNVSTAELMATRYADAHALPVVYHHPDYSRDDLDCGHRPNERLMKDAEALIVFGDRMTRGLQCALAVAEASGVPAWMVWPDGRIVWQGREEDIGRDTSALMSMLLAEAM